jgi:AsmA protein
MELDLTLDADAVTVRALPLRTVHIVLQYKEKQSVIPFEAEIFGGKIGGTAKLDLRRAEPRASLQGTVKNLNMEEATRGLFAAYSVTGTLGATLDLAGRGGTGAEFAHSLEGRAAVLINRGEVRGFSLIPSDLPHIKPLPANFPFERMGASAKISQGVAISKDISLQAPLLTARGGGAVHLAYGQMDLGLDFLAAGLPPAIPVSISGPCNSLSYSVDMRTFLRNVAESALQAPDKAGGLLRDVGGKLFQ